MMHKYWKDFFPELRDDEKYQINKFNQNCIFDALDVADNQLRRLLKFCSKNNYDIWIVSSMGQDLYSRQDIPEIYLNDFAKLISFLNLEIKDFELLPAMQPDVTIKFKSKKALSNLLNKLSKLKFLDNKYIFKKIYDEIGDTINLNIRKSITLKSQKIIYEGEKKLTLRKLV